jgi:dihydrofolate reductase
MNLHLIVAMTPDRIIGNKNSLPWKHMPSDIRRFRDTTMGHPCIMGSKTCVSILDANHGRLLEGRTSIVLTSRIPKAAEYAGAKVATSPEMALEIAERFDGDPFVIGGAQIYERMLPLCRVLHITHVYPDEGHAIEGDVRFPSVRMMDGGWKVLEPPLKRGRHNPGDQYESDYYIWGR